MSEFFYSKLMRSYRQGSVLSPYLFAVYVNDVDCSRTGCHVILYADDILLIAPTITQVEKLLHDCENGLQWLDMVINFKKSSCLRVGPRFNASAQKLLVCMVKPYRGPKKSNTYVFTW